MWRVFFFLFVSAVVFTHAYLPGVAPKGYEDWEPIPLKVNSLTSVHTQLPFKYYSLPFCRPNEIQDAAENLGEILLGDWIENSPYEILAGVESNCKVLCKVVLTESDLKLFSKRIKEDYRVHWLIDNLPAATPKLTIDPSGKSAIVYEDGFPLGRSEKIGNEYNYYIHNHVSIKILYNRDAVDNLVRIVGVEVDPQSVEYPKDTKKNIDTCPQFGYASVDLPQQSVNVDSKSETAVFTYSVLWEPKDIKWASRWDIYLLMSNDEQIHWFSILNSLMIVLFLTGMVAMIMLRTLRTDVLRYREMENQEELQEETGWKLVHGDVFRPPSLPMLLSSFVGSGVQVFSMTMITMIFAILGFWSPANRGALMSAMVFLFVFMGLFAGYFSSKLYKQFNGPHWKKNTLLTAMLFPGLSFGIFFVLNIILAFKGSTGAVPFGTLVALVALWFGISVPLVFLGSYFGYKKTADEEKNKGLFRTNQIPRQIPERLWYAHPILVVMMGGILPFGAVFIELFFIFSSIWLHQFYYLFGFLAIVFIILIITCSEISIVLCYFQLCSEDYHWWWRSFLTSGASAFYVFLYAMFYFFTKLQITQFVSTVLYVGYTLIMVFGFFFLTGFIGFWSCYVFVTKIYSSIKLE
eukprot:TRINITY_DN125_c0_g2_i1.p1 TRINITY_DN125_c0_g2~~TRINITY_DN125_c0_g2_i1.p1  ORF type:complete len:634 (+),score=100.62 TRINITY_DN125_c0_g2_i1:18-1919(+)